MAWNYCILYLTAKQETYFHQSNLNLKTMYDPHMFILLTFPIWMTNELAVVRKQSEKFSKIRDSVQKTFHSIFENEKNTNNSKLRNSVCQHFCKCSMTSEYQRRRMLSQTNRSELKIVLEMFISLFSYSYLKWRKIYCERNN